MGRAFSPRTCDERPVCPLPPVHPFLVYRLVFDLDVLGSLLLVLPDLHYFFSQEILFPDFVFSPGKEKSWPVSATFLTFSAPFPVFQERRLLPRALERPEGRNCPNMAESSPLYSPLLPTIFPFPLSPLFFMAPIS